MEFHTISASSYESPDQSTQKRPQNELTLKSTEPIRRLTLLRKVLWIEIIDYLDTWAYFCIIPQLNSFFQSLVKNCMNYRTSLKISMKSRYAKFYKRNALYIINNTKDNFYILNCQKLNKLNLNFNFTDAQKNTYSQSSSSLYNFFTSMISIKSIKILKLYAGFDFIEELKISLSLFENIEKLTINFNSIKRYDQINTLNEYLKNYQINSSDKVLKKLSIKYSCIIDLPIRKKFKILGVCNSLQELYLEDMLRGNTFEIPTFLKNKSYLKCIRLPDNHFFRKNAAEGLCSYLGNNNILEDLEVSNSLIVYVRMFIDALIKNNSLKKLVLFNCSQIKNGYFCRIEDLSLLLSSLALKLIENLSIEFSIHDIKIYKSERIVIPFLLGEDVDKLDVFFESLNYFLGKYEKLI